MSQWAKCVLYKHGARVNLQDPLRNLWRFLPLNPAFGLEKRQTDRKLYYIAACALEYLPPDPTCPWALEVRWHRVNDTDSMSRSWRHLRFNGGFPTFRTAALQ